MKHSVVFCTQPVRGTLYFYVSSSRSDRHYLFAQSFRPDLWNRFRFGVLLDDALDRSKYPLHHQKFCDKLFKAIPYIEKEYGVRLLRRSRRSLRRDCREDPDRGGIAA